MEFTLVAGVILGLGFLFGEIAQKFFLPKVTGYILAGIFLKLDIFGLLPSHFLDHTDFITNIALAFITFSVGGTLLYSRIRELGKAVISITLFEACMAVLFVFCGFIIVSYLFQGIVPISWIGMIVPLSILLGTFASPTDPATTLAVSHEYRARGNVSSTILGIAALDDAFGIIIFSLGLSIAELALQHSGFSFFSAFIKPLIVIVGGISVGIVFALIFNKLTSLFKRATKGTYIVLILGMITICLSVANMLGFDELLATMAMGCVVGNLNPHQRDFFEMMEHYIEELIFVLFFTISGMYFDINAIANSYIFIILFVLFRSSGKLIGARTGASVARAPENVTKYTGLGLIPQGGIVIGLALIIKTHPGLTEIADSIINIVIGATVIHELVGPVSVKVGLQKAGEILVSQKESAYVQEAVQDWEPIPESEQSTFIDILASHKVKELRAKLKEVETVPEGIKFSEFKKLFLSTTQDYFPIVNSKNKLVGIFSTRDFRNVLLEPEIDDLIVVNDIATSDIITTHPEEDLSTVMHKFTKKNLDSIPVVESSDGDKFLGMLRRKEVIEFYNQKVKELQTRYNNV